MRDDDAASGAVSGEVLRQHFGNIFVGQAVEAVAAHALRSDGAGQGEELGDFRLAAMEGSVEAGHLRHAGQRGGQCVDAGQVVGLVQRRQRYEAAQGIDDGGIQHDGSRELLCAMNHAMADTANLPAGFVLLQPASQKTQGRLVLDIRRAFEFKIAILQRAPVGVDRLEMRALATGAADAVNLAHQLRLLRDRRVPGKQGELDRGRAGVESKDGVLHAAARSR